MKTAITLTVLTIFTILVKSKNIPEPYKPTDDLLGMIFSTKIPEEKNSPSCSNKTCTIEEIYELFGVDPIPIEVTSKNKTTDNRVAFAGAECPSKYTRIGNNCVERD